MKLGGIIAACLLVGVSLVAGPAQAGDKPEPLTVVTAGDSITKGVGARPGWSYPDQLERQSHGAVEVTNVGHKGSCLILEGCYHPDRLLDTFRGEVLALHPDVAIVAIGTNDLGGYNPTSTFKAALRTIRAEGEAAGVVVLLATIPPARHYWPQRCEDQRGELNDWIRTLPHVDFAAALDTQAGIMRARFDSGDRLHPNAQGYRLMAREALHAATASVKTSDRLRGE